MGNFPTQELLETADRVTQRWKNAVSEIENANYGLNQWLRDAVGFWTHDVADVWLGAGRGTKTVLLTVNKPISNEFPVNNVNKVKLTDLGLLGGTNVITLKPPRTTQDSLGSSTGIATVELPPPDGNPTFSGPAGFRQPTTGEQYVGLLYEDQGPIATVIYLELR